MIFTKKSGHSIKSRHFAPIEGNSHPGQMVHSAGWVHLRWRDLDENTNATIRGQVLDPPGERQSVIVIKTPVQQS